MIDTWRLAHWRENSGELFCETIERPDLIPQHRMTLADTETVRTQIAAVFRSNTQAYWIEKFANVDCCVAPVLTLAESMDNEQLRSRGMFVVAEHPTEGALPQFAFPIKFSEFEFSLNRPAPLHGEHSKEILTELGYTGEQIAHLEAVGVI